jgi:GNAT superfamily N-acetyltransferase
VRPDLQARQLGRQILAEAEARARAEGALRVRMTVVHLRDTLIAWYQRRGYVLTGETLPFLHSDPPRDDLRFVVLEKRL